LERITIRDVAKEAGVGIGTVSRALNGGVIKKETREKILKAVKKLGYAPNWYARILAGGKTRRVMLITPEIRTEFHWRVIKSFDEYLDQLDFETVIYPIISENRIAKIRSGSCITEEVDAVVLCTLTLNNVFGSEYEPIKPMVLLETAQENYDSIDLDNTLGGEMAAKILLSHEAKDFFVLHTREKDPFRISQSISARLEGFRSGLKKAGICLSPQNILHSEIFSGPSHDQIVQIFEKYRNPAIFALIDNFALPILDIASSLKKIPGKDFFLVGYDDQTWTEEAGLTTIHQPIEEMGIQAAQLVVQKLQNPGLSAQQIRLAPKPVIRNTA